MKRPELVEVGLFTMPIRYDLKPKKKKRAAEFDSRKLTIRIDGTLDEANVKASLIHELLHAVLWWQECPFATANSKLDDEELEELAVKSVAIPLLTVLRANPELREYLFS